MNLGEWVCEDSQGVIIAVALDWLHSHIDIYVYVWNTVQLLVMIQSHFKPPANVPKNKLKAI